MINVDKPLKVENMETLIECLDEQNGETGFVFEHAGFLDLNEPAILEDDRYRRARFKKYGYAVRNR